MSRKLERSGVAKRGPLKRVSVMHEDNLNGTGAPKNHFGNHVCSFGPSFVPCNVLGSAFEINYVSYLSDVKKKQSCTLSVRFSTNKTKKGGVKRAKLIFSEVS